MTLEKQLRNTADQLQKEFYSYTTAFFWGFFTERFLKVMTPTVGRP